MEEQDIITSTRQNLEYNAKDDELIIAINKAIDESNTLKEKIDRIGKSNKLYWTKGTSKNIENYHPKKSRVTSNRIFTDVETAVPILTSEPPVPTVINVSNNDVQARIERGLKIAYEVKYKMQQKLQSIIRNWFLFRLGIFKYRWDKEYGFCTESVLPRKMGFDKRATCKGDCEYAWEELEESGNSIIEKFPDKADVVINIVGKENLKSKIKYIEFWGGFGEWVCWKLRDTILDKKKNPNFNYEEPMQEMPMMGGMEMQGTNTFSQPQPPDNIFDKPEIPYIFLNVFNLGDETAIYDETSLIEQASPLQEGVNQLEQQIIDLNEGQKRVWVASGEAVSNEIFQQLIDKTGDLGVFLDRKAPTSGIQQVQSGKPDASLFDNLAHLLNEIDNTIGIHSTTRGERGKTETLGGRQILRESDYGRLDLIVRNVEQVMEEWYNAYLQMIKVYAIEPEVLNNGEETIELRREEIPPNILIMIKKGSTLPTDDETRYKNAIQLAQYQMIDPATLFEEMKYTNIEKRVQDLYTWLQMTGAIQPQMQPGVPGNLPVENGQVPQEGQQGGQQLVRLQQILQSPQFQQLPPDQQQEMLGRAREIVNQVKQK